jgi:hypothetical protein
MIVGGLRKVNKLEGAGGEEDNTKTRYAPRLLRVLAVAASSVYLPPFRLSQNKHVILHRTASHPPQGQIQGQNLRTKKWLLVV